MNDNYIDEGYQLMTQYITEQRIKTKNRKFLRRLNKFYDTFKNGEGVLSVEKEREYLKLELYFFVNILDEPVDKGDLASLEVLSILANSDV